MNRHKCLNAIEIRWNDKDQVVIDQTCKDKSHRVIIIAKADLLAAADAIRKGD